MILRPLREDMAFGRADLAQPLMCCIVCREVYMIFDKRRAITLDEVLDMHYAMEHE